MQDSSIILISQIFYRNIVCKEQSLSDSERALSCLCKEELASIIGVRDKLPTTRDMMHLMQFIAKSGFEYTDMFVKRKFQSNTEIVYTIGYMFRDASFDVHIETEYFEGKELVHAGILIDLE